VWHRVADVARGRLLGASIQGGLPHQPWAAELVKKNMATTLVVDSIGFRDDLWLDFHGSPSTSAGKVRERITRPDFGHLNIEVRVDDPKAYTQRWTHAAPARDTVME